MNDLAANGKNFYMVVAMDMKPNWKVQVVFYHPLLGCLGYLAEISSLCNHLYGVIRMNVNQAHFLYFLP